MSTEATLELKTLTIRIPMRLARRGGRKLILTPDGAAPEPQRPLPDDTMIKALVRAHRWRRRIESGGAATINEVAKQEGVTGPYVLAASHPTLWPPFSMAGSRKAGSSRTWCAIPRSAGASSWHSGAPHLNQYKNAVQVPSTLYLD
jgi:hypothetical protein